MPEQIDTVVETLSGIPVLRTEVAGNPLWLWLVAVALALLLHLVIKLVLSQVVKRLRRLSESTRTPVDDYVVELLSGTRHFFLLAVAVLLASLVLDLSGTMEKALRWIVVVALAIQAGLWGNRAVTLWIERQREIRGESDPGAVTTLQGLSYVVRVAVWSAVALLMLDNLGFDINALIAGLGIGGIAIALAMQNLLGDLFASLSIALDKPFVTGDFIIVGDYLGTVSNVGLKTTRITSLSGEQLVFSNSDLLSSRIRNYKRMLERRIVFGFGVLYSTPPEKLEAIPGAVRTIVEGTEKTRFDRAHFKGFGASSYDFEVVYYVLEPDYTLYMDCQQTINLAICRYFAENDIEFAFPTRTLHLDSVPAAIPVLVQPQDED